MIEKVEQATQGSRAGAGLQIPRHYQARIELDSTRIELDSKGDPAANVLDLLGGYRADIGRSRRGHLQLTLIVPADNLRQALNTTLAVVGWAVDLEVLELEVGFLTAPVRVDFTGAPWKGADSA
jgi:hypothetical protein